MVDADQFDGGFQMASHRLERRGVRAQEDADPGDPDDAAGRGAFAGLLVGDVARVLPDRTQARVAVDDRAGRGDAQIQAGPHAAM